jgi:hypothetical protein
MLPRGFVVCLLATACVNLSQPPELDRTRGRPGNDPIGEDGGADSGPPPVTEVPQLDAPAQPAVDAARPLDATLDLAPPDAPLLALGRRCGTGNQCLSGQCVDGVCCVSACNQTCQACDVPSMEGMCLPIPAGQDPAGECPQDPASSCNRDGTCDGRGACRRYAVNTECVPGSCAGDVEFAARTCDGNGVCRSASSKSCSPNTCMGSSCATVCSRDNECQQGFFCDGNKCKVKRPVGEACGGNGQCASNYCVDGVCCSTPCAESCNACNVAGSLGTCTPVSDGTTDPRGRCNGEPPNSCGRLGGCNGKGGCRLHPSGTPCLPASCTGFVETAAGQCNGSGVCVIGGRRDCAPFLCGPTACATSCTGLGCKPGFICLASGACVPPPPPPTLYWKLDEEGGTMALDSSGNNLIGTYTGDMGTPTPSMNVPMLMFPNPRSRLFAISGRHAILMREMPALIKPANNLTVSAWYNITRLDPDDRGSEVVSAGNNYLLRVESSGLRFSKRVGTASVQCQAALSGHLDGLWHHIAAVTTPAGMKVYFDGEEKCTNTRGEDIRYDQSNDLWVGRHGLGGDNYHLEGNLDEVRIYTRPLSQPEIADLFRGGL